MSGPGERSRYVLTRKPLTHAVGKVLPAHRGTVHAMSIRRRASPGLDVASVTYDYAFAYGSDDDLVAADVIFTGPINPRTATVGVGGSRRLTEDRPIGSPGTCASRGRPVLASDPS
jgi:hypothetical protein